MVKTGNLKMSYLEKELETQWLELNEEVKLQLIKECDFLLGIGDVEVSGTLIRSGETPIRPDFSTPDAIHYQDFKLVNVRQESDQVIIETEAIGRPELYGEMMDEYSHNLVFPKLRKTQTDKLDWIIKAESLELDGETYIGLSYGFNFSSEERKIHKFTVLSTWEIGGNANDNIIYHQSYSNGPVFAAKTDKYFSTACLKRLDLWDSWLGNSYQLLPRWGCIQPFDFQTSPKGVLLGYWKDEHSIKSLVQKNKEEDVVFVVDEYDFSLTKNIKIPGKHIMFSVGKRRKHEEVNMWTDAYDYTTQIIRDFFGIKTCQPLLIGEPSETGKNSVSREELACGRKDDWLWKVEGKKFYFKLDNEWVESHDKLYWIADNLLPRLHQQGIKRVQFECVHESDFTEDAFAFHAENGWHSDLTVCSVCGSRRYVPAEFYDGWKGWNYLADKAKKMDISLGHWVGLHLTPRAPIVKEHPEYLIQHVNTLGLSGGYSHLAICSINWCSGAKQWFLDDMKRWHDEGGLEWLFFDSWPNLGCTALNYGGNMEPMQYEMGKVLAELQDIGYNWFSFEGTSPFGVHQYGLWDPMQDYDKHTSGGVMGQNDFGDWVGHEYMGYNQLLGPKINEKRDIQSLEEMSFRYMANRSLTLVQKIKTGHYQMGNNNEKIYQELQPLMQKRRLLSDDRGVKWDSDQGMALFSYRPFDFSIPTGCKVVKVNGNQTEEVNCKNSILKTDAWSAYKIS